MKLRKNIAFGLFGLLLTTQFTIPSKAQTNSNFAPTVACRQELAQDIEAIINRPQFKRSRWGIFLQNLDTADTIYTQEGDKFFIPASTVKLLTTAAALNELGADFRITTPIYATGELPYLKTVRIEGQGDPTITSDILKNIVQEFKKLGISKIDKLIIDDSYFSQPVINPTWEWLDTYYYYAPPVNSTILNENTARLTLSPGQIGQPIKWQWNDTIAGQQWQVFNQGITATVNTDYSIEIDGKLGQNTLNIRGELPQDNQKDNWDIAILEPANYFLSTFSALLAAEGIAVNQGIVNTKKNNILDERIIAQIYSPPLKKIITEINQDSNNLYAEAILKVLAKRLNTNDEIEALEISLNKLGITPDNYSLSDASGLSRQNLITPETLVDILAKVAKTDRTDIFQNSLSVAGNNGTLKNRLTNIKSPNSFLGKTGSLSGVITLSGYLKLSNQEIGVAILVNNFDDKNRIARQAIDEIVMLLPEFYNCV